MSPETKLKIWLVHGTWGNSKLGSQRGHVNWYMRGSKFAEELDSALRGNGLDFELIPFGWSGRNLIRDREAAALRLAQEILDAGPSSHGDNIIIAHSHGGNIAVRALKHLEACRRDTAVITLATPFVQIKRRSPSAFEKVFLSYVSGAISLLIFTFAFLLFSLVVGAYRGSANIIFSLVLASAAGYSASILERRLLRKIRQKTAELCATTQLNHRDRAGSSVLILRAPNDEADLAMAAGAIGNLICGRASGLIFKIMLVWTLISLTATFVWLLVASPYFMFLRTSDEAGNYLLNLYARSINETTNYVVSAVTFSSIALSCLAFSTLVLFAVGLLCKMVYGFDLFLSSFTSNVSQSSSLDSSSDIDILTLEYLGSEQGLTHAIYNNSACVEVIASWIVRLRNGRQNNGIGQHIDL